MKKPQAMMFYPEAWLSSPRVAAMPPAARSGYFDLMCSMWVNGGSLDDNDDMLRALSRLDRNEWRKHRDQILGCMTREDGKVSQDRLSEEYERTVELLDSRSKAGAKGARRRWLIHSNAIAKPSLSHASANGKSMQTETETETETEKEIPPAPLSDFADPDFDGHTAFEEVRKRYPKGGENTDGGRLVWNMEAVNRTPRGFEDWANRAIQAARIAALCPDGERKFLPNLKRFLEERVNDDWAAKAREWGVTAAPSTESLADKRALVARELGEA